MRNSWVLPGALVRDAAKLVVELRIVIEKDGRVSEERIERGSGNPYFDDCFVVRDLKIIQGSVSLFVAMPSKKTKDGTYRDTAHPLDNETRRMIEDAVIGAYERGAGVVLDGIAAAR